MESGGYFMSDSAEEQPMDHKSPEALINRIEYRLAHNVLSLAADDEWLLRDILFALKNGRKP